jgi:hypothetical protein
MFAKITSVLKVHLAFQKCDPLSLNGSNNNIGVQRISYLSKMQSLKSFDVSYNDICAKSVFPFKDAISHIIGCVF